MRATFLAGCERLLTPRAMCCRIRHHSEVTLKTAFCITNPTVSLPLRIGPARFAPDVAAVPVVVMPQGNSDTAEAGLSERPADWSGAVVAEAFVVP